MLYKFKSKAAGDVIMTQAHGDQLLGIIGKEPSAQGILTVDQMPAALQAIEDAIAQESPPSDEPSTSEDEPTPTSHTVGLRQRLWPFAELIRYSLKDQVDIVWGV